MKNLKMLIVLFGVIGLVSMFLPIMEGAPSMFKALLEGDKFQLVLMLIVFGLPTVVGIMGITKPPFQQWQAIAATAGFGLGVVKTHVWEALPHIMDIPLSMKLMTVAVVGGIIVSILAILKPENKA